MLYFLFIILIPVNIGDCVDDYFCDLITKQISCYTSDFEERTAIIELCPVTCDSCNGTQTPTNSPTQMEEEEHSEAQDTIILSVLGLLMLVVFISGIHITLCISNNEVDDEDDTTLFSTYEGSSSASIMLQDESKNSIENGSQNDARPAGGLSFYSESRKKITFENQRGVYEEPLIRSIA